ncbi:MAG: lysophospholipid acyltransferase family protein [Bauldia sp.]
MAGRGAPMPEMQSAETLELPEPGMPTIAEILGRRLALQRLADRVLLRAAALLARLGVDEIDGLRHIAPANDPFILVANHSSRREVVYLPALLALLRGGRVVHFLADWNFRLFPGVGFLFDRGGTITVSRKPARPKVLDRFRSRHADPIGPLRRARSLLRDGRAIGLFPEGTVNRSGTELLPGDSGAAWLSLATGTPVVPVGIRVRGGDGAGRKVLSFAIGAPIAPAPRRSALDRPAVADWHAAIMGEIARLSGKTWLKPDR